MATHVETLRAGGPKTPARPLGVSKARTDRRVLLDRLASRLVVGGGLLIIAAILAILVVIAVEVYPLFKAPAAHWLGSHPMVATGADGTLLPGSLGVDEYREAAFGVTATELRVLSPKTGAGLTTVAIPGLDGAQVVSIGQAGKDRYLLGTSDGRVIPLEMKFDVQFKDGRRTVRADPRLRPTVGRGSVRQAPDTAGNVRRHQGWAHFRRPARATGAGRASRGREEGVDPGRNEGRDAHPAYGRLKRCGDGHEDGRARRRSFPRDTEWTDRSV